MEATCPYRRPGRRHMSRRDFLALGALGGLALGLPASGSGVQGEQSPAEVTFGRAKRALLLFLTGGPPQHDTWDMKPDAPSAIRGELKPIATRASGVQISELFPQLAQRMDKVRVVRSVSHGDTTHTSAGYTMLTGATHPKANAASATMIRPSPDDLPHLGSWVARAKAGNYSLPFVSLPEIIKDANINTFPGQDAGLLGQRYSPLRIECNDEHNGFRLPPIVLPADVPLARLLHRRELRRV